MSVKQRILYFIENNEVSITRFYKESGVTYGVLTQKSNLSEDNIVKFLTKYPEVSSEWLLTGNGPMLKAQEASHNVRDSYPAKAKDAQEHIATATPSNEGIPLIPLDAVAGFGTGKMRVLEQECERYIVPMFREAQFLIPVKGASMQPKYNSGDLVACKKLVLTDIFFQWNKVYVLDTAQGALIKRICKGSDTEHIKLVSENEKYDPFELHLSQVNSVALVIGVIRLE